MPLRGLSLSPFSQGGIPRQITLYSPGGRNPADGGPIPPSPIFVTWATMRSPKGDEVDRAAQISSECRHILRVPYQMGYEPDLTVKYENRTFQLNAIVPDDGDAHVYLDLYCTEIGQGAGSSS